jgi:hypothetical protein
MLVKTLNEKEIDLYLDAPFCFSIFYDPRGIYLHTGGHYSRAFWHDDDYLFYTIFERFKLATIRKEGSFDFCNELHQLEEWRDDVVNNPDIPF